MTRSSATHGVPLAWSEQTTFSESSNLGHVSLVALDAVAAVVCYTDYGSGSVSTCHNIRVAYDQVAAPTGSLVVHPSATAAHSVARLGQYKAVSCYDAGDCLYCSTIARSVPPPPFPPGLTPLPPPPLPPPPPPPFEPLPKPPPPPVRPPLPPGSRTSQQPSQCVTTADGIVRCLSIPEGRTYDDEHVKRAILRRFGVPLAS